MGPSSSFRLSEHSADQHAVARLGDFAVELRHDALPVPVQDRLSLLLTDFLGVTVAGARTPEMGALMAAWRCPPGSAPLPGTGVRTTPETAAYLGGVAACMLELDEGNKYAAGHPAAHVVPAAVAAARLCGEEVSGERFLSAVAAGYEVAARFGQATRRDPRWHTHGHWGATGAACAASLLLGGDADEVAAAIDSVTGLMHVTPWETVLSGDFTRNLWVAGASHAGLAAARLARAGLVDNRGSAPHAFDLLGELDVETLTRGLGERWLITTGYLKRHASCSYTHAAVDLVQALQAAGAWDDPADVVAVRVRIHSLAEPLLRRHPTTRVGAMFSLPFVVGTAVVSGRVDPTTMTPGTQAFAAADALSDRVAVSVEPRLDAHLPHLRCTEVEVDLRDGSTVSLGQPNPIGDTAHFPLGHPEVEAKLTALVGAPDTASIQAAVAALPTCRSVVEVLDALP